jgi:DNA-binding XRE family transcriptional regulator
MIKNEKQLAVARRKLDTLQKELSDASNLEEAVLRELSEDLRAEIDEYVNARDGIVNVFPVDSIDHLAHALIKARVARHQTQAQLAEAIGVSEQMVQSDESGGYERAGLARLADVADVLGYSLRGELIPNDCDPWMWSREASAQGTASFSTSLMASHSQQVVVVMANTFGGLMACSHQYNPLTDAGLSHIGGSVSNPLINVFPALTGGGSE